MDQVQSWVAVIGSLAAAALGILKYFNYKSRRDRIATLIEWCVLLRPC